jgi:hypothetical protein
MTTREYPNHRKFKSALQRIIAESVAETLSEIDGDVAVSWHRALQQRMASRADVSAPGLTADRPPAKVAPAPERR